MFQVGTKTEGNECMITMTEIARMCHVSQAVVSRALANHPGVKPQTREKIMRVAQQYNYRPNALVRSLQSGRTQTVAVAANAIQDEFCGVLLRRVVENLQGVGYDTLLFSWDRCVRDHARLVQRINERRADGLLMFPPAEPPSAEYRRELRAFNKPVVLLDQTWPGAEYDFVGFDNIEGARDAVRHVLDLGHRRVACFHYDAVSSGQERKQGFLDAMIERGATVHAEALAPWSEDAESAQAAARALLTATPRPTAVVCFNDPAAVTLMAVAGSLGLSVPGDVSVVGFADLSVARQWRPRLTTMAQDLAAAADAATSRLLERIEERGRPAAEADDDEASEASAPKVVRLPVRLVERESCAPPPDATSGR